MDNKLKSPGNARWADVRTEIINEINLSFEAMYITAAGVLNMKANFVKALPGEYI